MALQKEIWINSIVENLFADNTFLAKSFNADEFVVAGKRVHIPNAAAAPSASVGPITRPKTAKETTDTDLDFDIKEIYSDPVFIQNADKFELSYDKRESVIKRTKGSISDKVATEILKAWIPSESGRVITTTGATYGTAQKKLTRHDILAAQTKLNKDDVPQEGRYLLLSADMHEQLLENLTEAQQNAFLAAADASKGVVGKLYGFHVMMRSVAGGTEAEPVALAWHEDYVCRAQGEHQMFEQENDPLYYGDVMSFLVRAGGSKMSSKGIGTVAIKTK